MQAPNPKHQAPNKYRWEKSKIPKQFTSHFSAIGYWNFEFVWGLGFEIWNFKRMDLVMTT
jgi:hypothetical protein